MRRPIRTVLVANRGEIARRIIRACRELGLRAVAVFSDADRDAPFVAEADIAVHLGAAAASESYLDGVRIIDAARRAGADAVHPGYGFLAENADFAQAVTDAGLVFIGPRPETIRLMGSKIAGKRAAEAAGAPLVPGYAGEDQSEAALRREAGRIGAPLLVKASAGGGGRGMRRVDDLARLNAELGLARSEAMAAFGDDVVLLERLVEPARHVEVQILADEHGNVRHLFDRDCSLQRRHQKVVEEAPAPGIADETRQRILACATRIASDIGYVGAGTVEFLLNGNGVEFYFIEMNTRLQVEHPVTECVTGIDIVAWQLRIAAGEEIDFAQDAVRLDGAAIEARLLAEDASADFLPSTGTISAYAEPAGPGIRVDSGVRAGSAVTHHYDSMIAKVIAHGPDRASALATLRMALADYRIEGVTTNRDFLRDLLAVPDFEAGRLHTGLIVDSFAQGWRAPAITPRHRVEAALVAILSHEQTNTRTLAGPWGTLGAWRVTENAGRAGATLFEIAGETVHETVHVAGRAGSYRIALADGEVVTVTHADHHGDMLAYENEGLRTNLRVGLLLGEQAQEISLDTPEGAIRLAVSRHEGTRRNADASGADTSLRAPMPGLVIDTPVALGSPVTRGQTIIVIEAMKLMQSLNAPCDGTLTALPYGPGSAVEAGAVLATIEPITTAPSEKTDA
jgi:acetyl/propionyl-CoA carboxylase alpha subunit